MKFLKYLITGIIFLIVGVLNTDTAVSSGNNSKNSNKEHSKKDSRKQERLTIRNLYKELLRVGVRYPKVALAVSMYETGWLKSKACVKYNNLFGMQWPRQRRTLANGYYKVGIYKRSYYKNWKRSVADFLIWEKNNINSKTTKEEYIKYLGDIYSINDKYHSTLKSVLARINRMDRSNEI